MTEDEGNGILKECGLINGLKEDNQRDEQQHNILNKEDNPDDFRFLQKKIEKYLLNQHQSRLCCLPWQIIMEMQAATVELSGKDQPFRLM